ncbi:MAG: glycosyltransferase [Oscillospiraceae bacterium]|nr:glycosyltransferase [Oscillospiraceae bacterium]
MRKPKVSIVIPVYNVENYLRECLDSTAGQTLQNIEIICVNDGSTDSSPAILEEYAAKDSRFVIVHQENAGVSAARNCGMDLAKGEYLLFLDSDDVAEPCLAQAAVEAMEEQGLDLLHFDAEVFFENGIMSAHKGARQYHAHTVGMQEPTDGMQALAFLRQKDAVCVCVYQYLFRREWLVRHEIRFIEGIVHEDVPFTIECFLCSQRFFKIDKSFLRRRFREGSIITEKIRKHHVESCIRVIRWLTEKAETLPDVPGLEDALQYEILPLQNRSARGYPDLSEEEKEALARLTGPDRYILQNIQSAAQLRAERSKNSRLWKENQQLKKDLTQARRERDRAKKEVGNICASLSYRVGRMITFIPRKVRGGYRCLKEHGVKYTVRRIGQKMGLL